MKPGDAASVQWSKWMFGILKEGGVWPVPRSGLLFKKEGGKLLLIDRMPYTPELSRAFTVGARVPASPSELAEYQQKDLDLITEHFRAAGIEIEDRTITPIRKD